MAIMGAGLAISPVSGVVASDYVRPAADAAHGAHAATTAAEPDVKAVPAAADPHATPHAHDVPHAAPAGSTAFTPTTSALTQKFTFDLHSRQEIYQLVDAHTHQVIQQVPDQALLATRAYSNAIHNGATVLEAEVQADIAT
jgi:hypothetical protein